MEITVNIFTIKMCRYFFLNGKCRDGDKCNFKHVKNENNHKRHNKKNTESFEPSHKPPDMYYSRKWG